MIHTSEIDIAKCIETFDYKNGNLYYKLIKKRGMKVGDKAGYFCKSTGYVKVKIEGKTFTLHRIIFAMHHGFCPKMVDHKNQDKLDNRIENLRPCSRQENVVNSKVRVDNPYGYKGVTFHKASGKFAAQTMWNQKRIHIGLFNTIEEAAQAYNSKLKELSPDFAQFNQISE